MSTPFPARHSRITHAGGQGLQNPPSKCARELECLLLVTMFEPPDDSDRLGDSDYLRSLGGSYSTREVGAEFWQIALRFDRLEGVDAGQDLCLQPGNLARRMHN